ncbi:MAG: hypothetical protein RI964_2358 [Pseudomonadota bacterium]|jgi:integrase
MAKLNLTQIRQLPRPAKNFHEYTVGSVTGLKVRVQASGVRSWVFKYKRNGKIKCITLGRVEGLPAAQAESAARQLRRKVEDGHDPVAEKVALRAANLAAEQQAHNADDDNPTFQTFAADFIERYSKPRKKSWRVDVYDLNKYINPFIGAVRIRDVTRRDIVKVLDKLRDRGANTMANRLRALLSRMFNWAIGKCLLEANPVKHTERTKEKSRERVLSDSEIRQLWSCTGDDSIGLVLRFMLLSAKRVGEVSSIKWSDIYDGAIHINNTKNGTNDCIPISAGMQVVLDAAKTLHGNGAYVFQGKCGGVKECSVRRYMQRIWGKAVVNAPTPHDLRRTAATRISMGGCSRLVLSKILNHVDTSVDGIYDRWSYQPEKLAALGNLWVEIQRIVGLNVVPIWNGQVTANCMHGNA